MEIWNAFLVRFARAYMVDHPNIDYFIFGHRHIELDIKLERHTRLMIFLVPLLFFLPRWWDLDGVWLSMPISDAISFFTACGMMWYMMKKLKRRENSHLTEQVSAH